MGQVKATGPSSGGLSRPAGSSGESTAWQYRSAPGQMAKPLDPCLVTTCRLPRGGCDLGPHALCS